MIKSKTPPLCRYCGKEITKHTRWRYLVTDPKSMEYSPESKMLVEALPQTKQEAQKLFNEPVISVKRCKKYDSQNDATIDIGIDQVSLWDGESYQDEFFCSGIDAQRFAYLFARDGKCTKSYVDAVKKQKERDAV